MIETRYNLATERIADLTVERTVDDKFRDYFGKVAEFIHLIDETKNKIEQHAYDKMSVEELADWNEKLYSDILPAHYEESYANPEYACSILGEEYGAMLSALYAEIRGAIVYVYEGKTEYLDILFELFIEVYNQFEEEKKPEPQVIREIIYWYASDYCDVFVADRIRDQIDPAEDFAAKIILESDLTDFRYLYRFGEYISESELKTAEHLLSLDEETIQKMADVYTEGYRVGFVNTGKDLSKKKSVNIR